MFVFPRALIIFMPHSVLMAVMFIYDSCLFLFFKQKPELFFSVFTAVARDHEDVEAASGDHCWSFV